jgi:signal peptidase I
MDELVPTQPTEKAQSSGDTWRFTAELIKTALFVGILAYVIRVFILQPFIVEGLSMYPQFHDKDYLLVDKLSYRLHEPERGDIIVFKYPKDPSVNYVKRIIGLPGETIRIEDSKVVVINEKHPQGIAISEPYVPSTNKTLSVSPSGKAEFIVPAGSYFVLGDNRMGSSDSREWGEMPKEDLIGRVLVQAYPLDRFALVPHADYTNL